METTRSFIVLATLLAFALIALPATGRADDVTVKVITPDNQPKPTPAPEPGAPTTPKIVPPENESPKPDAPKAADQAKAAAPAEKPLFDWPPPMVVLRSTIDRFGLTDEQKAKTGPILNAADREAASLVREMKDKDPKERRAAIYKLRDATVTKLLPLLTDAQGRRLKGAARASTVAPQGVQIHIGRDWILEVAQPAPSAIAELWLAQYAPGVDLPEPQAADLMGKLMPLAEQFAKFQSALASTFVSTGDKDDPETARKLKEECARQQKEFVKQQKPRREIIKAVREAISQSLSAKQRQAAHEDRGADLAAGVRHILDYYRALFTRANLNVTAEQKQKVQGLIDAASDALAKIAGGDEDQFPVQWEQLRRQLNKDLLDVLTAEQKEKLQGPTPPRPPDKKEPPKQGDNKPAPGPIELPPL